MKGLYWFISVMITLTACGTGGSKSKSGGGDAFPGQYLDQSFTCTGTSTEGSQIGQQYTLSANISRDSLNDINRKRATIYDQSYNQFGSYNSSSSYSNYNYSNNLNGVAQSQAAEAKYNENQSEIKITPDNQYGSNWSGTFSIFPTASRGEFKGQLNGVRLNIRNMSCQQTGSSLTSSGQFGQYGQYGSIPQYLTCQSSQYRATVNNGSLNLSQLTGSISETYDLITNGQSYSGQTSQTYSVQSRTGQGRNGSLTISQSNQGLYNNYQSTYQTSGNYTLQLSNVYFRNQVLSNLVLTCN